KRNPFINIKNYDDWFKKTIIRIIISAFLLMAVMIVKISNFQQPKKILNFVETKLESNFNIKTYLMGIKKLPGHIHTFGDKVMTAMKIENKSDKRLIPPIAGEITTYFDEKIDETSNISKGLIFSSDAGQNIYSVDDGVIIDTGSNKLVGDYIIIKHRGELLSVYKYVGTNHLNVNQRVKQGQTIGVSSGKLLLEIWYCNEPVDPIEYMNMGAQ
ncbi:MAG: M23 family metallopeptidase, partial [Alkaliphilus sp.]|nr:M23 family metallopeptidase [Alkaliphilus sp.]